MSDFPSSIQVRINGETRTIPGGRKLPELLTDLGLPPQTALVEHNGTALLRDEWDRTPLQDGDSLEILRVVAGG